MPRSYEEVRQIAHELPYEERARLSEDLWWSLHPPAETAPQVEIDAAWDGEIKRRIEEADSGAVELIPGEDVLARMDARIKSKQRE